MSSSDFLLIMNSITEDKEIADDKKLELLTKLEVKYEEAILFEKEHEWA